MKSRQLREQRAQLVKDMRDILNLADSEKREISSDERTNYKNIEAKVEELEADIERHEALEKREKEISEVSPAQSRSGGFGSQQDKQNPLYREALGNYFRGGLANLSVQQRSMLVSSNSAGGFLVPDEKFVDGLLKKLADAVYIRGKAKKYQIDGAKSGGIPTLDSGFIDAEWTPEVNTGAADTIKIGKRKVEPSLLSKLAKVSMFLLELSSEDPEGLVQDEMVRIFAATEEKGYMLGNGIKQPLGLFFASSDGISTDRDVSEDNTSTAVTFDGLINAQESVKDQYQAGAEWLASREFRKKVRKIKDLEGRYILETSTQVGAPSMLLGKPLVTSEFAPKTFTTGLYVALYGNLNYYGIADRMDLQVQRLNEVYATENKVGFIGRKETDGAPLLEDAFARVKLA